ncbi:MAG: hypothetical protein P8L28_04670 [Flavobacteriaceae bacterium]|nr:hypothetical protein [Flavobacteriaceae bacterium]
MLTAKLKHHFIKKKIGKFSQTRSSLTDESSQEIKTVGIITLDRFSKDHDFSQILIQKLQRRNPKIYSYRKFSKHDQKSYKHFSKKDFNWKGDILDTSLKSFLEEPFDLLICFYSKKNIFLEYVEASSEAVFKVGFSEANTGFFDLDIACNILQVDLFFDEMKKYLEILHKF